MNLKADGESRDRFARTLAERVVQTANAPGPESGGVIPCPRKA
jgi:hypothetical protein